MIWLVTFAYWRNLPWYWRNVLESTNENLDFYAQQSLLLQTFVIDILSTCSTSITMVVRCCAYEKAVTHMVAEHCNYDLISWWLICRICRTTVSMRGDVWAFNSKLPSPYACVAHHARTRCWKAPDHSNVLVVRLQTERFISQRTR